MHARFYSLSILLVGKILYCSRRHLIDVALLQQNLYFKTKHEFWKASCARCFNSVKQWINSTSLKCRSISVDSILLVKNLYKCDQRKRKYGFPEVLSTESFSGADLMDLKDLISMFLKRVFKWILQLQESLKSYFPASMSRNGYSFPPLLK